MRSVEPADLTTRSRIRDAAITLLAADGTDATSVRAIAAQADVSPGLVIHHYGSKDGLLEACDAYVARLVREANREATGSPGTDPLGPFRDATEGPPVLLYLARRLTDDSAQVATLVDEMVADAAANSVEAIKAGFMTPSDDPAARAAVLVLWSLGALAMRHHIHRILGADITADPGAMAPYLRPATEILSRGAFSPDLYDEMRRLFPAASAPDTSQERS
jgi:AcrR family transcriptional regulator